jgi:hypothetical protein
MFARKKNVLEGRAAEAGTLSARGFWRSVRRRQLKDHKTAGILKVKEH